MRTAAVFGASGKLGRSVVAALEKRGYAIRALVHRTPVSGRNTVSIAGSIADASAVNETLRGADVVIQLATSKEAAGSFFDVSLRGTFNVLEGCRRESIRQFFLFGGDAALGIWFYPQALPLDENAPRKAYPGYYAFSKVMEETMVEQYALQYGLTVTVLRSSWIFEGTDILKHFSLLHNLDTAEKGHGFGNVGQDVIQLVETKQERIPVLIDGRGTPLRRHIVHLDDVIQAFDRSLDNPSSFGQTFNISGPAAFDYRVAAEYISERLQIPTVELPSPNYHSFEINISRARSILGYKPENDIFRIVDRAIEASRL